MPRVVASAKGLHRVEGRAVPGPQIERLRVVDGSPGVECAQRSLPLDEVHHVAAQPLRAPVVDEGGRRLQIVHQPLPGLMRQPDDSPCIRVAVAHLDRVAAAHVGVGFARLLEAKGERAHGPGAGPGQGAVSRRNPAGQLDPVKILEIDRRESCRHRPPLGCGLS